MLLAIAMIKMARWFLLPFLHLGQRLLAHSDGQLQASKNNPTYLQGSNTLNSTTQKLRISTSLSVNTPTTETPPLDAAPIGWMPLVSGGRSLKVHLKAESPISLTHLQIDQPLPL